MKIELIMVNLLTNLISEIESDFNNNLLHRSLIKIRQIRCISKKRIKSKKWSNKLNIFWEIIDNNMREKINNTLKIMFWI